MAPSTLRIDAHVHVWDLARREQPWTEGLPVLHRSFGLTDLAPRLDAHAMDGAVVVHTVASLDETYELLDLAADETRVAGVVGWFDLESPALADDLDGAVERAGGQRLVGVRHQLQVEPDQRWLARDQVRAGLRTVAAADLVYDVVVAPDQLAFVADVVASLPEVAFVLDHAGKPPIASGLLTQWRADVTRLAELPNVTVKCSGLVTEADRESWSVSDLRPVVTTLLDTFGPERLMFGSDWPVCLLAHADYEQVVALTTALLDGLGTVELARVWGGTAAAVYGLEPAC